MSEKELGQKLDRCLADSVVKLGAGLGLGIVFSVVFFKRRTWPIAFATGAGLGMSYSNCQNDLRSPYILHRSVPKLSVNSERRLAHRQGRRAVKASLTLGVLLGLFFSAWLPFFITNMAQWKLPILRILHFVFLDSLAFCLTYFTRSEAGNEC
uniref:MICOS complex subunit MIC10 n=1 Tax=Denticeps clupeoides TaxID=299321 RepID=A0AAY4EH20_9TELE